MNKTKTEEWLAVCPSTDIPEIGGVAALINDEQLAIFRIEDTLFALSNFDPIANANVISRGILGSIGDELVVASPMYKQHYNLATGQCLEQADLMLRTYPVREQGQTVFVKA